MKLPQVFADDTPRISKLCEGLPRTKYDLCGGFTLWEISISAFIMVVIFSLGLLVSVDFYRQKVISAERDTVVYILKKARNSAQNNVNQSAHGIYFGSAGNYVIFQGSLYASRNPVYDEFFPRTGGMNISGAPEIVFSQLDGNSNVSGTVSISNGVKTLNVFVNSEGRIDW